MKKINLLLTALLLIAATSTYAQLGVRTGVNFTKAIINDLTSGSTINIKPGFHVGATYDIALAGQFAVQPGLLFSTKGFKGKTTSSTISVTPYYLELPVNFLFKPELGTGKLLLGAGPYVAYGIGGKWKQTEGSISANGKLEFINDYKDESKANDVEPYGKKLDAGLNMLVGYELANNLSVQLNAQLGLMNIRPKDDGKKSSGSSKNIGFGISLGYKF